MIGKTKAKTKVIQVRVSDSEKEKLAQLASAADMEISPYMRLKSLYTDSDFLKSLPDTVKSWNLLNEVIHEIEKSNDPQLKIRIEKIMNRQGTQNEN